MIKKLLLVFVAIVFAATSLPFAPSAHAIDECDEEFLSSNNIMLYNPCVSDICPTNGGTSLTGETNREKIYNFLVQKGLNKTQASGVLGNIKDESGYSPTRHEDSKSNFEEGGYGIAQWTGGRRASLVAYLEKEAPSIMSIYYNNGFGGSVTLEDGFVPRNSATGDLIPIADNDVLLNAELNFLYDETSSRKISSKTASHTSAKQGEGEWEALKKATTVEDATKIWLYNFENPANIEQAAVKRTSSAEELFAILPDSASDESCLDTTSGSVAALQATVKSYAWPEYTKGYVTLKPEYRTAVSKARANGGYVGGNKFAGVDCGGFVTRVMVDSGYEPNYNSAKGYTAIQRQWLDENWTKIGTGNTIDTATLQPGDVAMQPGHTFMFAGTDIDGFGKTSGWKGVASASLDQRAPMAGMEPLTASDLTWYRKGVVNNGG